MPKTGVKQETGAPAGTETRGKKQAASVDRLLTRDNSEKKMTRQVDSLYALLGEIYGIDQLVLKAGKLDALRLLRSRSLGERVLALEKVVYEDPTLDVVPGTSEIPALLHEMEETLADYLARRSVEDRLEHRVAEKMQERHDEYLREIRSQVLKENSSPENAQTLKRLAILEKMEQVSLARSAMEVLRPRTLEEIVGQERAIKALVAKIASPFPQHVILYGPPGVGKTTAARLALEAASRLSGSAFAKDAPFIEVNGATLRWDPREVTNPLIGSVHDPIYQGARRDLAETGIPEPKLGLVSDAHGGILFIDELGEMDPLLLNKLLKVLEDKRVYFESAYYEPDDNNVPQYIQKIFDHGAPADFLLIGATTREPEELNPAIRSRCAEIYFEPLTPGDIQSIVSQAVTRLGVEMDCEIPGLVSEYTIEGRKAISILADAYSLARYQAEIEQGRTLKVCRETVLEAVQISRLSPYAAVKASQQAEIGRTLGLGVYGFVGSILEIEAVAFKAREAGRGQIRFNETAGSQARDSVFNAASVFRKVTAEDLSDYDIHVNVIGGGNIDGPSAGLAIFLAILSAVQRRLIRQDLAVTGEISIQGKVKPVGGIVEKIYGAKQAGMTQVLVPLENIKDVLLGLSGIVVQPVETVEEAMRLAFLPS